MARITKAEQSLIPNVSLFLNGELLQTLDQDEVADRVYYAKQLMTKAAATTDPTLKQSWNKLAGAVLQAPKPREQIEKQVEDLRTKARLSWNAVAAAGLRDEADRVLAANPIAPRRQQALRKALRKAADSGQIAVYDANGNLVGTCDPEKVTRLIPPPQPSAGDDQAAAAGQRDMGTAKNPPAAETPAADTPDEITKQRRTGVLIRRPI